MYPVEMYVQVRRACMVEGDPESQAQGDVASSD